MTPAPAPAQRPVRRCVAAGVVVVALAFAFTPPSLAHDFRFLDVVMVVQPDGRYHADLTLDLDALALGVSQDADDAELVAALEGLDPEAFRAAVARAARTLERRVRVRFDGTPARAAIAFPEVGRVPPDADPPSVLGVTARVEGHAPTGAGTVSFFASRAFGSVRLTYLDAATGRTSRTILAPGEIGPAFPLGGDPAALGDAPAIAGGCPTELRFLWIGFEHILPLGLDHMAFVVGLFLLSTRWAPLLVQVSAFTVAHTATLALATLDVISLPDRPVEILIALSIAWIGIENVATDRLHAWRPVLVFAFGLLHGLGFAGALAEVGLPRDELVPALVSFNVGVELGQIAVIAIAFAAVGWLRRRPDYRKRVVIPGSIGVAALGAYWAAERIFGF